VVLFRDGGALEMQNKFHRRFLQQNNNNNNNNNIHPTNTTTP
jgi:hypothetical protein